MAIVKFNVASEFTEELEKDRDQVDRHIVRVTRKFTHSKDISPLRYLSLVATAKVNGDIIRLEKYLGEVWGLESGDQSTFTRADQVQKQLEGWLEMKGLTVRAGILEEA